MGVFDLTTENYIAFLSKKNKFVSGICEGLNRCFDFSNLDEKSIHSVKKYITRLCNNELFDNKNIKFNLTNNNLSGLEKNIYNEVVSIIGNNDLKLKYNLEVDFDKSIVCINKRNFKEFLLDPDIKNLVDSDEIESFSKSLSSALYDSFDNKKIKYKDLDKSINYSIRKMLSCKDNVKITTRLNKISDDAYMLLSDLWKDGYKAYDCLNKKYFINADFKKNLVEKIETKVNKDIVWDKNKEEFRKSQQTTYNIESYVKGKDYALYDVKNYIVK